jgi:hypothetical protein
VVRVEGGFVGLLGTNEVHPHPAHRLTPPPGYFACRRRIERLRRYLDLIRHRERWGLHIQFARPLEQLIGENVPEAQRHWAVEQAISRLSIPVWHDLDAVGVATVYGIMVDSDDIEKRMKQQQVRRSFDLIREYFTIPRHGGPGNADIFEQTDRALHEGIGAYEALAARRRWDFFNPLMWCVWVLRAPVFVLHMAGIASGADAGDKALRFVAWTVGLLMIVILVLLSVKLGVSIPWNVVSRILPW